MTASKKWLSVCLLLTSGSVCALQADDGKMLVSSNDNLGTKEFLLSNIQTIICKSDGLEIVKFQGGSESLSYAEIQKIFFDLDVATGLQPIERCESSNLLLMDDAKGSISLKNEVKPNKAYIYASNGSLCASQSNWNGSAWNVSALAPGYYVLKINGQFFKFKL